MTNSLRISVIRLLAFAVLLFPVAAWAQKRPPIAEQLAKTYGLDSFGQVEAIRYTFNLQFPGVNISRSWVWEPKTGQISYEAKNKDGKPVRVTYQRSQLSNQSDAVRNDIDPAFFNDQYDLFFPFHVSWDTSAEVKDLGTQKLPLGKGSAKQLSVEYPAEAGGANPGDTWELFIGSDGRVEALRYLRGGPKPPHVVTANWTSYKKAGPLLVATEWRGTADGKPLHLFYSNVAVKLTGSDAWVNAAQ